MAQPPQWPAGQGPEQNDQSGQPPQYGQPQPPQYGQPAYGQPPYGAPQPPQYGQPQYGAPQPPPYGQPQYGQPQYGQPPAYGQPQYGQPDQPWETLNLTPAAAAPKRGRGRLIAAVVAVVALAVGGVATYVAISDKNSNGAASPTAAVQSVFTDLNNSDLVGFVNDLAPGERTALVNPMLDSITQLKRLHVLKDSADPNSVSGVQFSATGLTYDPKTITVNDHVAIVQLTGGTLTVGSNFSRIPFTSDFVSAAFPNGAPSSASKTTTVSISQKVAQQGSPIRLAAEKVGGRWYPSLFYTVADNAAHAANKAVTPADYIPAVGASSPTDAVRGMVNAAVAGDLAGVIKLISPDELPALHDYGNLLLANAHTGSGLSGVTINQLDLSATPISGGGQRVTLTKVVISKSGSTISVELANGCVRATVSGATKNFCANDIVDQVVSLISGFGGSAPQLTAAQRTAFADLFTGLTKVGVDVGQSGGKWYITPVRSYLDLTDSILSGLQGNDILELAKLINSAGH
jgi:hypothetical protein